MTKIVVRISYYLTSVVLGLICFLAAPAAVSAQTTLPPQERMCDPTFEDCRADLLQYIRQENVQIDVGYWFMTDARYSNELVRAWQRGVRIRLLMDSRCGDSHAACTAQNDQLAAAGIPMRRRIIGDILHWKTMIFAGQGQVEFAGANYAPFELTPETPYVNFTDEIVYFSKDPAIVQTFMTKFDELWTSTTEFGDYANITAPLTRSYPISAMDPQINFPPDQSYRTRAVNAYALEQQQIDVMMFRITDEAHTIAMLNAIARGVPVRLITDEGEYRNPARLLDAYNVDKMYYGGVQVRLDGHQGINHAKLVVLRGRRFSIFGSSNWTPASTDNQREHNMFTSQPWINDWLEDVFDRKWNNSTGHQETKPFVPLPPDAPVYQTPADGATNVATTGTRLVFYAGLWAHLYDIYFGTTPDPPLLAAEVNLGPSSSATDYRSYALPQLQPGTRYYWKIVSKTMARVAAAGPVRSFVTGGTAPEPPQLPAGWNATDVGATGATGATSFSNGTFTVAGAGADVWGTADAFHFAYRTLSGDGSIVARVTSVQNVDVWTKAGVMIRNSLSASAAHGFMIVSAGKGVPFQRRTTDGNISDSTPGSQSVAPRWVRLVRAGNVITASESADGATWTTVNSDTFAMGTTVFVGLAVTSHVSGVTATATFDNVTITSATPPANVAPTVSITSPGPSSSFTAPANITLAATASDSDGTISKVEFFAGATLLGTVTAAPYQLAWNNVAAGTYSVTARATDNQGAATTSSAVTVTVNAPQQAGLPAGWTHADIGATGALGNATATGGTFSVTGAGADVWGTADAFHFAYRTLSGDGTIVARVASIQNVNSWTKAGVMIRGSVSESSAHGFMLVAASATKGVPFQRRTTNGNISATSPGSQSTAPRWVKLVRAGNVVTGYESADGASWTMVGSDTIALGTTALIGLGVSSHVSGVNATATFDNVTITSTAPPANVPPTVSVSGPGAASTAPATISLSATASDPDGTVSKVDFFSGTALLGTVTAPPYQLTWSNVPAGTYSVTARATDDEGAATTSSAITVTVNEPPQTGLPAGWTHSDIGATGAIGDATAAGGTFSVTGAGADVWGTADALHYAYRTLNGNGTIIARVSSIDFVNSWTKAGVMIRESTAAGSAHAFMLVAASPVKGVPFQRRTAGDNISASTSGSQNTAPRWVKLVRSGTVISGYESADGVNWTLVGSDTFSMGPNVLIGLAVSSHVTGTRATATFDNVQIQ